MNIEEIKNLKFKEKDLKELCSIVGIEFKIFKPFNVQCSNKECTEEEYIQKMIETNINRIYYSDEIKNLTKLYCNFCYSNYHSKEHLKEYYGVDTINKIIEGIKSKLERKVDSSVANNVYGFKEEINEYYEFHNHKFANSENDLKEVIKKDFINNAEITGYSKTIYYKCIQCHYHVEEYILSKFFGESKFKQIVKELFEKWEKKKNSEIEKPKRQLTGYQSSVYTGTNIIHTHNSKKPTGIYYNYNHI